jgi:hypothetical protein
MSVVSRLILVQVPVDAADKCAGTVAIAATEIIAEQGLPIRNPLRLGFLSCSVNSATDCGAPTAPAVIMKLPATTNARTA